MRWKMILWLTTLLLTAAVAAWAQPCAVRSRLLSGGEFLAQDDLGNQGRGPLTDEETPMIRVFRDPVSGQVLIQGRMGGDKAEEESPAGPQPDQEGTEPSAPPGGLNPGGADATP